MTITSPHNEKLKAIRRLNAQKGARARAGRFVAEGEDLLAAADGAGWVAVERYAASGSGLPGVEVEASLLAGASALGSGTRTLAVYEERFSDVAVGPVCVYLHGIADPGNVGTVLRSAEAFGAACVALGPGTADPFGPKAVRASMGAIFTVPVVRVADGGIGAIAGLPGTTIALDVAGDRALAELWQSTPGKRGFIAKAGGDVTLMIGAERTGLPSELAAAADLRAHIPIANHSLNAAMAATVALYEVTRMAAA